MQRLHTGQNSAHWRKKDQPLKNIVQNNNYINSNKNSSNISNNNNNKNNISNKSEIPNKFCRGLR